MRRLSSLPAIARCLAQLTSFSVVASCGLLPRTTRPGPRLRTAFWSVASPHPREVGVGRALTVGATFVQGEPTRCGTGGDRFTTGPARRATRRPEFVARSGRIATDQKAVRTRGP